MNDQQQIKLGLAWLRGEVTECDPEQLKQAATAIEARLKVYFELLFKRGKHHTALRYAERILGEPK